MAVRLMDVLVAGGMLMVTAPLLATAALLVWIVDGAPVFYRGERMGHGGRSFMITKLRTLRTGAQAELGGQLVRDGHAFKTRTGNFLRETRIDELPQLWTVLKGDMAIFGPRPERREVFEAHCADIPGYEERFRVRPGVFGYAQILTPHGTPKRIRAMLDTRFARQPPSTLFNLVLVALTIGALFREIVRRELRFFRKVVHERILGRYRERRTKLRVQPRDAAVLLDDGSERPVIDANEDAVLLAGEGSHLRPGDVAELRIRVDDAGRIRRARVLIDEVHPRAAADGSPRSLLVFRPADTRSDYLVDQYLLERAIVKLPRSVRRLRARRLARVNRWDASTPRTAA